MNSKELLEKYPKAAEVIIKYYSDQFLKSINESVMDDDFKEFYKAQQIDNEYVAEFIDGNPRGTFDVLDENNVNIIIHVYTEEPPTEFAFSIAQHDYDHDELYPTRKEAEAAAVQQAFKILNNKL